MLLQIAKTKFHAFLWLSTIPFYMYIPHLLYSSVYGHLGFFHILAIVNNVAMNIGVHVSSKISAGVELLGYMVVLFLVF